MVASALCQFGQVLVNRVKYFFHTLCAIHLQADTLGHDSTLCTVQHSQAEQDAAYLT